MAGIDDAVLRRRQLDLDKRTADLQKYFERLARVKMAGMASEWRVIESRLKRQIRSIYTDMGAIQDPRKLKALTGKVERLEAYLTQIQADLARNLPNQQAYATGILKHQFEKAYYMDAWAVGQAAKVTATVPVLTPAQVLGVLVNPWLPDGANYSDRIRANTKLLAREMKNIIQQAVEDGLDWNTTAHMISAKTGEGYFRAVRLARTELNRAAALGASYSYLQNQDILDGKRWNAILDSRTAPKDAANDGKLYDLDYDTPENPSVPGQRIPNHPNCRCIWSPTLSALGVSGKERVAKDADGNRIYTKARTYREYAKEIGLPDLDDRLANDRLKQYLRPSEAVTDINKGIKSWTYQGKTIQVPTPNWVKPPNVVPPIVQVPSVSVLPKEVQQIKDITSKYYKNGVITDADRVKHARELLDSIGLQHINARLEKTSGAYGYCSLDSSTMAQGTIRYSEYVLKLNDLRTDAYKVKTAFHEFFHASATGTQHDFVGGIWSLKDWLEYEETFTECAAHYMAKEVGVTELHPSYAEKLVRNLPRLKKLNMFKDCNTIDDFGEVMVKYRIIDKKDSIFKFIDNDVQKVVYDKVDYFKQHYADYVENNLDAVIDKTIENALGNAPYRSIIKRDIQNILTSIKQGKGIPSISNGEYLFAQITAAAMRLQGVK